MAARRRRPTASCPIGILGHRTQSKYSYNPDEARALLKEAGVTDLSLEFKTLNEAVSGDGRPDRPGQPRRCRHQGRDHPARFRPVLEPRPRIQGRGVEEPAAVDDALPLPRPIPPTPSSGSSRTRSASGTGSAGPTRSSKSCGPRASAKTDNDKREEIYLRMQEIMEDTGAYVWITCDPLVLRPQRQDRARPSIPAANCVVEHFKKA